MACTILAEAPVAATEEPQQRSLRHRRKKKVFLSSVRYSVDTIKSVDNADILCQGLADDAGVVVG